MDGTADKTAIDTDIAAAEAKAARDRKGETDAIANMFAGGKAKGWHAICIWLSQTNVQTRRRELAQQVTTLLDVASDHTGHSLTLGNSDVLSLIRDETGEIAEKLKGVLNHTFSGVQGFEDVCKNYDLEKDFVKFVGELAGVAKPARPIAVEKSNLAGMATRTPAKSAPPAEVSAAPAADKPAAQWPDLSAQAAALAKPPPAPPKAYRKRRYAPIQEPKPLISPVEIAKVEKLFYMANVVPFVHNQTVYSHFGDGELVEAFDEIFISVDQLTGHFRDKYLITADRWLFQYLSRTLDDRLLMVLGVGGKDGEKKRITYSVNLNVSTLQSEPFLAYDHALPPRVRRGQILEIQAFDIVENIREFHFLSSFLRTRGYKICADGVDRYLFDMVDWRALGVDAVKLKWEPNFAQFTPAKMQDRLAAIALDGRSVILCRCDDETALDWGERQGISMFQGWYLDRMKREQESGEPRKGKYYIQKPGDQLVR